MIPAPGSKYGPCRSKGCGHRDCAESRRQAGVICPLCGKRIGYATRFYQRRNWTILVHEACADDSKDPGILDTLERQAEEKGGGVHAG